MEESEAKKQSIIENPANVESSNSTRQTQIDPAMLGKALEDAIQPKINELNNKIDDYKKELITILGIFASFITFVSVEFKLFENVVSMGDFISLSILLVSLMIVFVITLQSIIKS